MSIGQIYGTSFSKLRLGQVITGPFEQIGNFHPAAPVEFGTLLKFTTNKKHYVAMDGTEKDPALFAGIALAELAGTPHQYPGTKTRYEVGEPGNVLIVGTAVVELTADADVDAEGINEGGKVYLGTDGKVTTKAVVETNVEVNRLTNLVFTGDVEVQDGITLVGVRKLY